MWTENRGSVLMPAQPQRLRPRHLEIMHRLMIGESQKDIASELKINESTISVIVNAPLFKKEYAKLMKRREARLIEGDEDLYKAYSKAPKFHLSVIENSELPIPYRQTSATAVINAMQRKLAKVPTMLEKAEEEIPFETKLEKIREITWKEKIFGVGEETTSTIEVGMLPEPEMPNDDILDENEDATTEAEIAEEDAEESEEEE